MLAAIINGKSDGSLSKPTFFVNYFVNSIAGWSFLLRDNHSVIPTNPSFAAVVKALIVNAP